MNTEGVNFTFIDGELWLVYGPGEHEYLKFNRASVLKICRYLTDIIKTGRCNV